MAEEFSNEKMLALPNQAGKLFNPDSRYPVRQKHLFVLRFVRAGVGMEQRGLTFVAKSVERPSVEATTETLNQYNKKKLIHTGVRYNPVNATFYDTADGTALNMWVSYAKHYFADYNQDERAYFDDLINSEMNDPNNIGWGFKIPPVPEGIFDRGAGTQNYFSAVQVYQVWGQEFISYKLLNPRITNFTPDELSYDTGEVSTISTQIQYEAIEHLNGGYPMALYDDAILSEIMGVEFSGKFLEVTGQNKTRWFTRSPERAYPPTVQAQLPETPEAEIQRSQQTSEGGVLSSYGSYDFGLGDPAMDEYYGLPSIDEIEEEVDRIGGDLNSALGVNRNRWA